MAARKKVAPVKPAKTQKARKRGGKTKTSWKPGQSGNPKGRPAEGESWTGTINRISNMTGEEAAKYVESFTKFFKPLGKITLKEAVVLRSFAALLFEPQASMLNAIMERGEGKLSQTIRTWQDEVIELLRTGQVEPAIVRSELGDELARELINAAGLSADAGSEDQAGGEGEPPIMETVKRPTVSSVQ